MIVSHGGVMQPQGAHGHDAAQEAAQFMVGEIGDMEVRQRGTEHVVGIGGTVDERVHVKPVVAVQQGDDEGAIPLMVECRAAHHVGTPVAVETRREHFDHQGGILEARLEAEVAVRPVHDPPGVTADVLVGHVERLHGKDLLHGFHGQPVPDLVPHELVGHHIVGFVLAAVAGVIVDPPFSLVDLAPDGMQVGHRQIGCILPFHRLEVPPLHHFPG